MQHLHSNQPIGIFDSGIGGLTLAKALVQQLPHESIIYFGDTAHMPYGDKSVAAIQAYSIKIAHMLLQQRCKLILIACNTASAVAYELVKEYVGKQAMVLNVVDPTVAFLREHYAHKKVGLIATRPTVNSNIYKKKIDALNINISLRSHATPLLASAIEEGFSNHIVIESLLQEYLASEELKDIDALVLACTHYPIIKHKIAEFYQGTVDIIDTSDIVAQAVYSQLQFHQLLTKHTTSSKHFYVSDYTESFVAGTQLFFHELIKLEHYPLWE
jgi:glutamate racemase